MLSRPAGVELISGVCTMCIQRQWKLIQIGYLKFKVSAGSAGAEVAQFHQVHRAKAEGA